MKQNVFVANGFVGKHKAKECRSVDGGIDSDPNKDSKLSIDSQGYRFDAKM